MPDIQSYDGLVFGWLSFITSHRKVRSDKPSQYFFVLQGIGAGYDFRFFYPAQRTNLEVVEKNLRLAESVSASVFSLRKADGHSRGVSLSGRALICWLSYDSIGWRGGS